MDQRPAEDDALHLGSLNVSPVFLNVRKRYSAENRRRDEADLSKQEVWVMYTGIGTKKKIISAWRYPGVSPLGRKIPIPDEILQELENMVE